uniref:Uncharacterized protein n=1 Tax=viral metagenome TaxID=1070528 RepID=A0A6M3JB11_9ZZZZ
MNKWRKRARRYKESWYYYIELLKKAEGDIRLSEERLLRQGIRELTIDEGIAQLCRRQYAQHTVLSESDAAALNKVDELRRDAVRLATELARVQGVCDATVAQVQKHAATIIDLRERENVALKESEEYQRCLAEVRGSLARIEAQKGKFAGWLAQPEMAELMEFINDYPVWDRCAVEPKEET